MTVRGVAGPTARQHPTPTPTPTPTIIPAASATGPLRMRSATMDPLAPIRATVAAMAARPGQPAIDGLAPGVTVAEPDGWVPATELTSGDALPDLLATARQRWQASPHVAAAVAWKYYTYWVALPAVIGFVAAHRVPDLRPSNVVAKWSVEGRFLTVGLARPSVAVLPTDPLAAEPTPAVGVVPDEAAMLDGLRQWLLVEHFDPVLDNLRLGSRLGRRTLTGSIASAIAHAVSRVAAALAEPALGPASRLLTALHLADLVDLAPATAGGAGLEVRRKTCCLAFALPEPKLCAGCCLR